LIPGMAIPSKEQIDSLVEFLKKQFALSSDSDYEGLIPLAILLYGPAKELLLFLHNMLTIEGQIMNYLETLGADIESGVKTAQNTGIQGGIFAAGPII